MTPWTVVRQAPLSMEFSREEQWSGSPFSSPGDLPNPGIEPRSPVLAGRFFTTEPPEKPLYPCLPFYFTESSKCSFSNYPCINPYIYPSVHPPAHTSTHPSTGHKSIYLFISIHLLLHPLIQLATHLCIQPASLPSIYLLTCHFPFFPICPYNHILLSIYSFIHPSLSIPFIHLSVCPHMDPSTSPLIYFPNWNTCPFAHPHASSCIHLFSLLYSLRPICPLYSSSYPHSYSLIYIFIC